MTKIKIETDSDVCNAMKEELGGYTTAHGREAKASEDDAMLALDDRSATIHWSESIVSKNNLFFITVHGTKITECWNRPTADVLVQAFRLLDATENAASPAPDPVRTALADRVSVLADFGEDSPDTKTYLNEPARVLLKEVVAALRAPPQSVGNPLGDAGCGDPSCKDPNCTYGKESVGNPLGSGSSDLNAEGIKGALAEGDGFWNTCTGCHNTEDGHDVGHYPHSKIFGCKMGGGCSECGGLGVIWDTTDYEAMAEHILSLPEGEGLQAIDPLHSTSEGK